MSRAVVLLLLVVAVAYTTAFPNGAGPEECGPNEEFNACGSACVDTCDKKASPICVLRCVVGCQCKQGYVKNSENQCVLTRDC
ncbi:chymotrypsin inhibitor-like [Calliopsis andreniformis]|uniref:chymotrypsin inhibitor-like n=1 Tax=Calliopsis andreniformis TaxID=337506 RepID=UPI003FCDCBA7